ATMPAAVAVVLHIPSRSTGVFNSVVAAAGDLPVESAEDGMRINHGQVYLAVPDHHLIIQDGHFRLGIGPRENLVRPAIDPLFRSAAAAYGPRAIGVVLSGKLNDGADGLRAIKRCGGIALVQSPHDSGASEMPLAALEATSVDLSAEADKLGPAIL
ncbi:chemotaxis protein CheB, partial [Rhizobiaceae sp. 2RAB30]